MNYLAHIYLSGNNKLLMIGNFIGDYIKGHAYEELHPMVCKGVLLHRAIDDYTDRHPINVEVRKLMHPYLGKYSGVYLDMFYDHFLAAFWTDFSPNVSLRTFCIRFYFDAIFRYKHLPVKARAMLPSLMFHNRLRTYADLDKLKEAFDLMSSYTSLPHKSILAIKFLEANYDVLKKAFYEFFPQLVDYTAVWRERPDETDRQNNQIPDLFLMDLRKKSHQSILV